MYIDIITSQNKTQSSAVQKIAFYFVKTLFATMIIYYFKGKKRNFSLNLLSRFGFHLTIKTRDYILILGIGLGLACNGGSCGGISLKRD